MQSLQLTRSAVQIAIIAALGAGLVGCGGGGGDGSSSAPLTVASVDLTSANRDTVAHASAAGILGLSPVETMPLAAGSSAAAGGQAQALGEARSSTWLGRVLPLVLQSARTRARSAGSPQVHALAASIEQSCPVSGTVSVTFDDVDLSGGPSPGDVLTIVYRSCKDTSLETLDGTATNTYTQVGSNSMSARMTLTRFSDVAPRHSMTIDGSMLLDFSQPGGTVEVTRVTADGPFVASVSTHLPFADTVTLSSGFVEEVTYDPYFPAPPGGTQTGRGTSTFKGTLRSDAAGGLVEVSSLAGAPLTKYDADAYPRAGVVQVKGKTGSLLLTAVSADSVRLALDANGDGTAESTEVLAWDWLF
jgi:hypothetical protein